MPASATPPLTDRVDETRVRVPVLETPRLLLRGWRADDFDAYARILADPDVARFLSDGRALSTLEAWRQMAMIVGHWTLRGFGLWAVEEKGSGALVGRIGVQEPTGWPGFELAYTLRRESWGRGYAQEGAGAALHFARTVLGRTDILSVIRPANAGSVRVATALGAVKAETVEFFGGPADLYRYPAA